jgi:hypothetical protein
VTWLVDPRRRQNKKETIELLDKMRGEKNENLRTGYQGMAPDWRELYLSLMVLSINSRIPSEYISISNL